MSYQRVIPRDFFNEAKLLKCMGRLSLLVHDEMTPDGVDITITGNAGDAFQTHLTIDGLLIVSNYRIYINGESVRIGTRYNSKEPYPFIYQSNDYEEFKVFDERGDWTEEFTNAAKSL